MANTFYAAGTSGWELLLNGAAISRFGVQIHASYPVDIYVGQVAPVEASQDYITLSNGITRELVMSLAETDVVYVRSQRPVSVALRGFREARE